jgi:hypothetical protein
MSTTIIGIVTNGVVIPNSPLPEGVQVEIRLRAAQAEVGPGKSVRITPGELRKMPRAERQAVLAVAAALAEDDYRNDKELTGFDAFSEEELDGDESDCVGAP